MPCPTTGSDGFARALASAQRGEAGGFEWLFEAYGRRVHGFVRAQAALEPEDAVSEVFASAFRSIGSFVGSEDQFASWLFRIARNQLIDRARQRARRPHTTPTEVAEPVAAPVDVEREAIDRVGQEWVMEVLAELSDDQRDVMVLRFVADLSIQQTADALGKPPGAVKALQHRAIAAVRRKIAREAVSR